MLKTDISKPVASAYTDFPWYPNTEEHSKRLRVLPGYVSMTTQLDSTNFVPHRHDLPSNREIWPQYKYKFGSIVFPVKSVIYKAILSEVPSEELRLERL